MKSDPLTAMGHISGSPHLAPESRALLVQGDLLETHMSSPTQCYSNVPFNKLSICHILQAAYG